MTRLEEDYDMSDFSELHFFFGVYIEKNRSPRTIILFRRNYIEEVLKRFGMDGCKPIDTALDAKFQLLKLSDEEYNQHLYEMQGILYKEAVGSYICHGGNKL